MCADNDVLQPFSGEKSAPDPIFSFECKEFSVSQKNLSGNEISMNMIFPSKSSANINDLENRDYANISHLHLEAKRPRMQDSPLDWKRTISQNVTVNFSHDVTGRRCEEQVSNKLSSAPESINSQEKRKHSLSKVNELTFKEVKYSPLNNDCTNINCSFAADCAGIMLPVVKTEDTTFRNQISSLCKVEEPEVIYISSDDEFATSDVNLSHQSQFGDLIKNASGSCNIENETEVYVLDDGSESDRKNSENLSCAIQHDETSNSSISSKSTIVLSAHDTRKSTDVNSHPEVIELDSDDYSDDNENYHHDVSHSGSKEPSSDDGNEENSTVRTYDVQDEVTNGNSPGTNNPIYASATVILSPVRDVEIIDEYSPVTEDSDKLRQRENISFSSHGPKRRKFEQKLSPNDSVNGNGLNFSSAAKNMSDDVCSLRNSLTKGQEKVTGPKVVHSSQIIVDLSEDNVNTKPSRGASDINDFQNNNHLYRDVMKRQSCPSSVLCRNEWDSIGSVEVLSNSMSSLNRSDCLKYPTSPFPRSVQDFSGKMTDNRNNFGVRLKVDKTTLKTYVGKRKFSKMSYNCMKSVNHFSPKPNGAHTNVLSHNTETLNRKTDMDSVVSLCYDSMKKKERNFEEESNTECNTDSKFNKILIAKSSGNTVSSNHTEEEVVCLNNFSDGTHNVLHFSSPSVARPEKGNSEFNTPPSDKSSINNAFTSNDTEDKIAWFNNVSHGNEEVESESSTDSTHEVEQTCVVSNATTVAQVSDFIINSKSKNRKVAGVVPLSENISDSLENLNMSDVQYSKCRIEDKGMINRYADDSILTTRSTFSADKSKVNLVFFLYRSVI